MIVATTYIILNCVPVALKLQKYIRLLVLATTTANHQTLPLIREGAQQLFFVLSLLQEQDMVQCNTHLPRKLNTTS